MAKRSGIDLDRASVRRFTNTLQRLDAKFEKRLEDALIEIGYDIDRDAKKSTPVKTGRLRSSIHVEHSRLKNYRYSAGGNTYDGSFLEPAESGEVKVGTNVEYGEDIEDRDHMIENAYNQNIGKLEFVAKKHLNKI